MKLVMHAAASVCLCLTALTTARAQAPEKSSVDLTPLTELRKDVITVARCSNGELMMFWKDRVASVEGNTLKFKPSTWLTRVPDAPVTTELLERMALVSAIRARGFTNSETTFKVGTVQGKFAKHQEPVSCEVTDLLQPVRDPEAFDKPVQLNQMSMAGRVEGSALYESVKAEDKGKVDACIVEVLSEPTWAEPVAADLRETFMTAMMTQTKKGPPRVARAEDAPAGARAMRVRVLLYSIGADLNATFTWGDPAGRLLTRGHAFRTIGKKRVEDVKDLVEYLPCP